MQNFRVAAVQHARARLNYGESAAPVLCTCDEQGLVFIATDQRRILGYETRSGAWKQIAAWNDLRHLPNDVQVTALCYSVDTDAAIVALSDGSVHSVALGTPVVVEVAKFDASVLAMACSPDGEFLTVVLQSGHLVMLTQDWEVHSMVSIHQHKEHQTVVFDEGENELDTQVSLSWRGDSQVFCTCTKSVTPGATAVLRVWSPGTCALESSAQTHDAQDAGGLSTVATWQPNGRHIFCATALEDAPRVALLERNGLAHGSFVVGRVPAGDDADIQEVKALSFSNDSQLLMVLLGPKGPNPFGWYRLQVWLRSNWHWYLKFERQYPPIHSGATALPPQVVWSDTHPKTLHVLCPGSYGDYECLQLTAVTDVSRNATVAVVDGNAVLLTPLPHGLVPPPLAAARLRCRRAVVGVAFGEVGGCEALASVTAEGAVEVAVTVEGQLWEETAEETGLSEAGLLAEEFGQVAALQATRLAGLPLLSVCVRHVCWPGPSTVVAVGVHAESEDRNDSIWVLSVEWLGSVDEASPGASGNVSSTKGPGSATPRLVSTTRHQLPFTVAALVATETPGRMLLQAMDGKMYTVQVDESGAMSRSVSPSPGPPEVCERLLYVPQDSKQGDNRDLLVGATASGKLYINDAFIAERVTSCCVRAAGAGGPFVLYTVQSHVLCTLPLCGQGSPSSLGLAPTPGHAQSVAPRLGEGERGTENVYTRMHAAMRPAEAQLAKHRGSVRAVEPGARLLACAPGTALAVLQMPRGNLEGVYVRVLCVASVAAAMQRHMFHAAFTEASVMRLDLNVLTDLRWPAFLGVVEAFVGDVGVDGVVELLQALKPGSCLQPGSEYAEALRSTGVAVERAAGAAVGTCGGVTAAENVSVQASTQTDRGEGVDDKVNVVCRAVHDVCLQKGGTFLRGAIMACIRRSPPDLPAAIQIIYDEKVKERNAAENTTDVDALVSFLLLHVEAEEAYKAALSLYELRTAYMLITNSQLDPAEHLLELEGFAALSSDAERRFCIDVKLGRHLRALQAAVEGGAALWARALAHACKHGLVRDLLTMPAIQGEARKEAQEALAEDLERKGKLTDAAVAHLAYGNTASAQRCYESAGEWEMAFSLALRRTPPPAPTALHALGHSLIDTLVASGRQHDAGTVAALYLQDAALALQHYVDAGSWRSALQVAGQAGPGAGLGATLEKLVLGAAPALIEQLHEDRDRVVKYGARAVQLRERRAAFEASVGLLGQHDDATGRDDASVVTSLASDMSAYATHTATAASLSHGPHSAPGPSTLGGRGAGVAAGKLGRMGRKRGKIRQGSPEEEAKLLQLVADLAPSRPLCSQVAEMSELLILFENLDLAHQIQRAMDAYATAFLSAVDDLQGPDTQTSEASQCGSKTLLSKAADLRSSTWKWSVLRTEIGHVTASSATL